MTKLLWIDMEMTGLDVNKEMIIELAVIITDLEFRELETFQAVIKQEDRYLNAMDDWNRKTHKESGLTERVRASKTTQDHVEEDLMLLLNRHFGNEKAVIAGNSIMQDRLFIDRYLTKFAQRLHYRQLDVTSWKIWFKEKHHVDYRKQNLHRAIDDIRESIGEFRYYISFLNPEMLTKSARPAGGR
jgi:oligoribonuclease